MSSSIFDGTWYLKTYSDVNNAGHDADKHFNTHGWQEGRDPNPFFDTSFYRSVNRDVDQAGGNPLEHYETYGGTEGRDPGTHFDSSYYLDQNADVKDAGINPLYHFLTYGAAEGRLPYSGFDETAYRTANPDVDTAIDDGIIPCAVYHWAMNGLAEGRSGAGTSGISGEGTTPSKTFTVTNSDGHVTFGGTATGDITFTLDGDNVATFTRDGIEGTGDAVDFDDISKISLTAGQVLVGTAENLSGKAIDGSGTVSVTALNATAAADLSGITADTVTAAVADDLTFTGDFGTAVVTLADGADLTTTAAIASGITIKGTTGGNGENVFITDLDGNAAYDLSKITEDLTAKIAYVPEPEPEGEQEFKPVLLNEETKLGSFEIHIAANTVLVLLAGQAHGLTFKGMNTEEAPTNGGIIVTACSGDQTITGTANFDILTGGVGADTIDGGEMTDMFYYLSKGTGEDLANMDTVTFVHDDDIFNFQTGEGEPVGNFNAVDMDNNFTATAINVSEANNGLSAAIKIAIDHTNGSNTGTDAELNWFELDGNTYVVYDHADDGDTDGGLDTNNDFIIKLVGTDIGLESNDFVFDYAWA